jgi:hypothetical protein
MTGETGQGGHLSQAWPIFRGPQSLLLFFDKFTDDFLLGLR